MVHCVAVAVVAVGMPSGVVDGAAAAAVGRRSHGRCHTMILNLLGVCL